MPSANINRRIRGRMGELQVTQTELASRLNVPQPQVSERLRGEIRWRVEELLIVAERLDTTVAYLVGETDVADRPADAAAVSS